MIRDLAVNLLASALWTALVVIAGALWYMARGRAREKVWIREHGLMLLVYFRNVDGRCQKIHEWLTTKTEGTELIDVPKLRYELVKLQADLDAFDRLTQVWARRLDHFPIWYPYARTINGFLEAQAELHVALCRHVAPLIHRLDGGNVPMQDEREDFDLAGYLGYFRGGYDRIWGYEKNFAECTPVDELRKARLADRLKSVLSKLNALLQKNRQIELAGIRIWKGQVETGEIWFGAGDEGVAQRTGARH